MARYVPWVLFLAAAVVSAGVALTMPARSAVAQPGGPAGYNDAGSGQDAGDSPFDALLIAHAPRIWTANFTPVGTDADWYRLASGDAFCAAAEATTRSPGQLTLASDAAGGPRLSRTTSPHEAQRLVLAAAGSSGPIFGVEPSSMMLMAEGNTQRPGPGHYTFSLTMRSYADLDPEGDGETPEAGATSATAAPLAGECTAGRLAAADAADRYAVDVAAPRALTFSLAGAAGPAVQARVVSPSGATVATVGSGQVVDVWAGETGRWEVIVERPPAPSAPAALVRLALPPLPVAALGDMDSDYILSMDGPPDPEPCRPACFG